MEGIPDERDGYALPPPGEWPGGNWTCSIQPQFRMTFAYLPATDWSDWLEIAADNTAFASTTGTASASSGPSPVRTMSR